jgi:hypothetical protein
MYERRYGDCKSLTTALCAEYRLHGIWCRPVHRYNPRGDGNTDYHILLETESGWEDPSANLGMGVDENRKFFGPGTEGNTTFLSGWQEKLGTETKKKGLFGLW